jgi:hypothetical protein
MPFMFPCFGSILKTLNISFLSEPITIVQDLTLKSCPLKILDESERVMRHRKLKYLKIFWDKSNGAGSNLAT